jgi:ABC-type multidrug transport system fused ATPase/permease subunit
VVRESIKKYILALGRWGWVVMGILAGDIVGIATSYISSQHQFVMPIWGWWLILILVLLIAPFLAFHKMRIEHDRLNAVLDERKKNEKIANDLAEFAANIHRLRDQAVADLIDVEEYVSSVEPYILSVNDYLIENCGKANAALFNTVTVISNEVTIQLDNKLNNLLRIIEFYRQRSDG